MLYVVLLLVVLVDQLTKTMAAVAGMSSLNPGISFGLLDSLPSWMLTVGLLVLLLLIWLGTYRDWQREPVAAGLFVGGSISNLLDRVRFAGVRDWLPVPLTSIHNNLADYAIFVGLAWLVLTHWLSYWRSHHHETTQLHEANQPEED